MKLTILETINLLREFDEMTHSFASSLRHITEPSLVEDFYTNYASLQGARRELYETIELAKHTPITMFAGEPISYHGLTYFVRDLNENTELFEGMGRLLDENNSMMGKREINRIIDGISAMEDEFSTILTNFEDTHLINIDDELYAFIRDKV